MRTTINEVYFYHPDHLGSSSWVTGSSGQAVQHIAYGVFGENFVNQKVRGWETNRFFGEKDSESSYYYYGDRYYWGEGGFWLSVDPYADHFPRWTPYNYCMNDPIRIFDIGGAYPTDKLVDGGKLTSKYGMRFHPIDKVWKPHNGIDLLLPNYLHLKPLDFLILLLKYLKSLCLLRKYLKFQKYLKPQKTNPVVTGIPGLFIEITIKF